MYPGGLQGTVRAENRPRSGGTVRAMTASDPSDTRSRMLAASATDIAAQVARGAWTAHEVVEAHLERAARVHDATNCFTQILHTQALDQAAALDARLASAGEDARATLPLAGVPFAVKANIGVGGVTTDAASTILKGHTPPHDATVVARLKAAGAILIATTNQDEFGMGGSSERSAYGPVRNPWDASRVAGGSSGGSAAAVAAGAVPLALGTDTGGSVRQPAAFCGVIGFKPTYGTLSRSGLVPFASSLDQVGILARHPGDVAVALDAMVGRDASDATTVDVPSHFAVRAQSAHLDGLRVGIVRDLVGEGTTDEVQQAAHAFATTLAEAGAQVRDVALPSGRAGVACYYLISSAEASSNLARYDGMILGQRTGENAQGQAQVMTETRSAGFGPEVRRRMLMGTFALAAGHQDEWYGQALRVRRKIAEELDTVFSDVDVLLTPTAPSDAYELGELRSDPLEMYLGDVDTCLANLAGVGAISLPAGLGQHGMPVGMQLMAPAGGDDVLLNTAVALAGETPVQTAPL